jgi:hypothetical protein
LLPAQGKIVGSWWEISHYFSSLVSVEMEGKLEVPGGNVGKCVKEFEDEEG